MLKGSSQINKGFTFNNLLIWIFVLIFQFFLYIIFIKSTIYSQVIAKDVKIANVVKSLLQLPVPKIESQSKWILVILLSLLKIYPQNLSQNVIRFCTYFSNFTKQKTFLVFYNNWVLLGIISACTLLPPPKKAFLSPSVLPRREYTWTCIWTNFLVCFESCHVCPIPSGRVESGWWTVC